MILAPEIYVNLPGRELSSCAVFTLILSVTEATICYKDQSVGNRTGNVYYCDSDDATECCQEEGTFTCCEEQSTKIVREQLILWGSLAAIVLVIAIIVCYFWKDINCCKDDTPLKERCCRCCTKKDDEEDLTAVPEPGDVKSYRLRSNSLENFNTTFYRDTPIPAFTYKPKY